MIFETTNGNMKVDSRLFSGVKIVQRSEGRGFVYTGKEEYGLVPGEKYSHMIHTGYTVSVLIYGEWFTIKYISAEPDPLPDEYIPSNKELGEAKCKAQLWIYENLPEMR